MLCLIRLGTIWQLFFLSCFLSFYLSVFPSFCLSVFPSFHFSVFLKTYVIEGVTHKKTSLTYFRQNIFLRKHFEREIEKTLFLEKQNFETIFFISCLSHLNSSFKVSARHSFTFIILSLYLSFCLSVYLCLSFFLFICLSGFMSFYLSVFSFFILLLLFV